MPATSMLDPSDDQLLPFQRATLSAPAMPPAFVKSPPRYRSLPEMASARTRWLSPAVPPSALHETPPVQRATKSAKSIPSALMKFPPT